MEPKINKDEFDMDSFGPDCPSNYQEIADYLNDKLRKDPDTDPEQLWDDYCSGALKDAPLCKYTRTYRIYGLQGHRQRESFFPSYTYDWSTPEQTRILEVKNSDITGTNEYTELTITRNSLEEVEKELDGQTGDGIFENSNVGYVEEVEKQ